MVNNNEIVTGHNFDFIGKVFLLLKEDGRDDFFWKTHHSILSYKDGDFLFAQLRDGAVFSVSARSEEF